MRPPGDLKRPRAASLNCPSIACHSRSMHPSTEDDADLSTVTRTTESHLYRGFAKLSDYNRVEMPLSSIIYEVNYEITSAKQV